VLESAIAEVLAENPKQLAQLRAGKDALRGFFVGQIMKKTRGQANPALVAQLLDAALRRDAGEA
jgi:aspartyl-tRNA(Asn)/glutamyl-tRNA(Gln) amidotransferase subunit B